MSEMVELEVKVWRTSAMAIQVTVDGKPQALAQWVPRSVIDDYASGTGEVDHTTTSIFIPQWIAEQKGLV